MIGVMDLVRKLRSPESKLVLEAVEALRARGWLEDGSLRGVVLCHAHLERADLCKARFRLATLTLTMPFLWDRDRTERKRTKYRAIYETLKPLNSEGSN